MRGSHEIKITGSKHHARSLEGLLDFPAPATRTLTACQRLCLAVLGDALHLLWTTRHPTLSPHARELRTTTLRWFLSDDDTTPYTFAGLCSYVPPLDADAIRTALAARHWHGVPHLHRATFAPRARDGHRR